MDDAKNAFSEQNSRKLFPKILPTPLIIDMEQAKSRKINTDQAFAPL
jgi:hypothetical protein